MQDKNRTKDELIAELDALRAKVQELEKGKEFQNDSEKEREDKLHILDSIIETANEAIISMDHHKSIISFNPRAEELFGYRKEEVIGENVNVLMPSPFHEEHNTYVDNFLKTGKKKIIGIGREVRGKKKDGTEFPLYLSVSDYFISGDKKIFTGIATDMTDIKQTHAELEKERDRAQQYLNIAGAMLVALDADGIITMINKKGCEILGCKESEIMGENWFDNFVPGEIKDDLKTYFSRLKLDIKNTPENYVNSVVAKDGEIKIIAWHNKVFRDDDGNFVGTLSSGEDITQQKAYERELQQAHEKISEYATGLEQEVKSRTQELEEANKEMEAFSFTVAHDLRSPLRHINGFAELLRKKSGDSLNADSLRYVQMISESANRLGRLIDDVLDFSKMKRVEMRRMPVNLGDLIESVKSELMHGTEGRDIRWKIAKLPMLEGDPSMLRVAFVNLLSNALKYTMTRKQAKINMSAESHDNHSYIIKLEDNGVGFDMRYIDKIFGVFQRLHSDNEFEGTGIGLAVVQRIVHRHKGEIWAESEINKGSSFYIKLPKK